MRYLLIILLLSGTCYGQGVSTFGITNPSRTTDTSKTYGTIKAPNMWLINLVAGATSDRFVLQNSTTGQFKYGNNADFYKYSSDSTGNSGYATRRWVDSLGSGSHALLVKYSDSGTVYYSKYGVDTAKQNIRNEIVSSIIDTTSLSNRINTKKDKSDSTATSGYVTHYQDDTARTNTYTAIELKADKTITITPVYPLSGGGDLSANRTFALDTTLWRSTGYNDTRYSPLAGSSSITTLGTVTTGTWNGSLITGTYGGTGVANSGKTITLGGNISTASSFTTSGANSLTLTTTATTNATLPSGTTTLIGSTGGTISSTGLLFSNTIQAKFGGSGAFTIDNSSSTGFCKFNMQTGGYEWLFQYNGTTFWRWYESGSGSSWRALQLMNKGVIRFDMSSGLNSVPTDGEIASDGTNLFFYKSKWRILDDGPAINATSITGTSNINLTYNFTTRYVDATTGGLILTIIPTYAGQITYIKRLDASGNTVTVKMNSGNIDGAATVTPLTAQYKAVAIQWDGTNGYIIGGY